MIIGGGGCDGKIKPLIPVPRAIQFFVVVKVLF